MLLAYVLGSLFVAGASIVKTSAECDGQFLLTIVALSSSAQLLVILNALFCLVLLAGKMTQIALLGKLNATEQDDMVQNLKISVVELCIALTMFHSDFSYSTVLCLVGVLFLKCFHWLAASRVDRIARGQPLSSLQTIRLFVHLSLLLVIDTLVTVLVSHSLLVVNRTVGPQLLFGFEVWLHTRTYSLHSQLHMRSVSLCCSKS